jgi:hypothetical protein
MRIRTGTHFNNEKYQFKNLNISDFEVIIGSVLLASLGGVLIFVETKLNTQIKVLNHELKNKRSDLPIFFSVYQLMLS